MVKAKTLSALGLVVATLSIVSPIAWDLWSNSYDLSIIAQKRALLIERKEGIEGLRLTLQDKEISKLFATEVSLENSGRRPISKEDVLKPVVVTVAPVPILAVAPKPTSPPDLPFGLRVVGQSDIQIEFDLLNSRDKLSFNVLTEASPDAVRSSARIKNIKTLDVRDLEHERPLLSVLPTSALFVGPLSLAMLLLAIYAIRTQFGPIRRDSYAIKNTLRQGFDKETLRTFLKRNLWAEFPEGERKRLDALIEKTDINNAEEVDSLAGELFMAGLNQDPSGSLALGALVALVGIIYSVARLAVFFVWAY